VAYDVFISYGHQDKLTADAVCARLEGRGIRCWIAPRDLLAGQSYAEGITDALRGCRAFVLIFSGSANLSRHVSNEVERAVHHGLPVVPLRIEDVKPSGALEYFIGSVHWLDALTPPLDRHLERLADSVDRLLQRPTDAPRAAAQALPPRPAIRPRLWLYAPLALALIGLSGWLAYAIAGRSHDVPPPVPTSTIESPPPKDKPKDQPAPDTQSTAPVGKRDASADGSGRGAVAASRPARATATRESPVQSAVRTTPAESSQAPPVVRASEPPPDAPNQAPASIAPPTLTGCWIYNSINLSLSLRFYEDGRATGFLDGGRWSAASPNEFVITWPPTTDTVSLSDDGKLATGSNNYAGAVIRWTRVSGQPTGLAGNWRNQDGRVFAITEEGETHDGPVGGKWTRLTPNSYRIVWAYVFVDRITLSADGGSLTGRNQLNMPISAVRRPCAE
jgi:TIR domain-containing protein